MPVSINLQEPINWAAMPQNRKVKMILKAFSIRDSKGEIFHPPYYAKTHGEAERNFTELCRDEKSTAYKYPEDFDLYYIGEYDDQTGKFETLATPQHLLKAVQLKVQ